MAFEQLLAFAYEVLVAGDGFSAILRDKHSPNELSVQTFLALARW